MTKEVREEAGGICESFKMDVMDPALVQAAIDNIEQKLGKTPNVLVNTAAGNFVMASERLSPNVIKTVVDIVLLGTLSVTTEVAKRAMAKGHGCLVLSISTPYARNSKPKDAPKAVTAKPPAKEEKTMGKKGSTKPSKASKGKKKKTKKTILVRRLSRDPKATKWRSKLMAKRSSNAATGKKSKKRKKQKKNGASMKDSVKKAVSGQKSLQTNVVGKSVQSAPVKTASTLKSVQQSAMSKNADPKAPTPANGNVVQNPALQPQQKPNGTVNQKKETIDKLLRLTSFGLRKPKRPMAPRKRATLRQALKSPPAKMLIIVILFHLICMLIVFITSFFVVDLF